MIKRCISALLLTVIFALAFPLAAFADVILEPNDAFYHSHSGDYTDLKRYFYANGRNGFVSLKEAPDSQKEIDVVTNGDVLWIAGTCPYSGVIWGITEITTSDPGQNNATYAWVPMDQLLVKYDYISFYDDHKDKIFTYSGNYDSLKTTEEITLWSWPGSGVIQETLDPATISNLFAVEYAYKDGQGRIWGFVYYWMGLRNAWICLSDPTNTNIPAFNPAPAPQLWQPADVASVDSPPTGDSTPLIVTVLVLVAVAGTAVLIRVFWKPKEENES
ncbi:MAG: hypothetical protein FWF49_03955 [Oscillospiraceae bacterium]|nr:hypothetical protein [Oscillospiraceae bacterium]